MMFGNAYMRQNDIAVSGLPDHDFVLSGELGCLPAIHCGLPGDDEQDALLLSSSIVYGPPSPSNTETASFPDRFEMGISSL